MNTENIFNIKEWDAILFGKVVPWDEAVEYLSDLFWITKKDEDKEDNDWG